MSEQNSPETTQRLITEHEAAEMLSLSVKTLRAWRFRGEGVGFVKLGRSVRYQIRTVEQFIEDAACTSTATHGRFSSARKAS